MGQGLQGDQRPAHRFRPFPGRVRLADTASGPLMRRQSPNHAQACHGISRNSDPSANAPGQGRRVAPPAVKTPAAKVKMVFAGPVARTQPNRALRRCRRPSILNRDGAPLIQPSSCVVLVRTCFPSWTTTIAISENFRRSRTTDPPGGAAQTSLRESVPLEALPASRRLVVLHSCPFVRFVTANNATCRCAKDAMVTSKMARSTAHHRTF